MKKLIIAFILGAAVIYGAGQVVPLQRVITTTITTTTNITTTVSIITEKQKCKNAGGSFSIQGKAVDLFYLYNDTRPDYELICTAALLPPIFDYKL